MSPRYQLTCPCCNRRVPIETSQAGQTLPCECGESLSVPTMLKIKRLPLWGDNAPNAVAPSPEIAPAAPTNENEVGDQPANVRAPHAAPASSISRKPWGLFTVASLFTIAGAFVFCANLRPVDPVAVFYKRVEYASGDGKTVRRDSSPIDQRDYSFYFLDDPVNQRVYYVNDSLIDDLSYFHAYHYLDSLKTLEMSDNFYENYDALKSRRVIFLAMSGVAVVCGVALALFALFAPEKRRGVGATRGDAWH